MKVMVMKISKPDGWYIKKIGKIFKIVKETNEFYEVRTNDCIKKIAKSDCQVVSW